MAKLTTKKKKQFKLLKKLDPTGYKKTRAAYIKRRKTAA